VDVSVVSSKVKDIILYATIDLHNNYFLSKCGACKLQREKCIFILSKPKMLFEIPRLVHWAMINLITLFGYRKCGFAVPGSCKFSSGKLVEYFH